MKKLLTIIAVLIICNSIHAQCELIRNGNFESYTSCPNTNSQISFCNFWHDANVAPFAATYPSSDYFNCSFPRLAAYPTPSPSSAHSGTGLAGINATGSNPTAAEMLGTCANIIAGQTYTFSMWVFGGPDFNGGSGSDPFYLRGTPTCSFPVPTNANYCPTSMTTLATISKASALTSVWTKLTYVFTAPSNFAGIIIGGNCSTSSNYYVYIDDVSLLGPPAAPPTASSGGVITCSSPNVTLTGGGGGSYSWSGPGIVSGSATANPVVNAGGTYNLTVVDVNGCSASTSVIVSQNTNPPSPTATSGGVITCSNPNVTLTGGGGVSYSWSGPSIVSGATTANPIVNAGGTYNVTVTGSNGCNANTSVNVVANNTPPSPTASAGSNLTCANTSLILTGGGGGTYSWTGPGIVSGATTANPTINQPGTYNLTVTNPSNGCSAGTSVAVSQNITVPSFALSTASTLTTTCANPSTNLSASSNADPNTIYTWLTPLNTTLTGNPVSASAVGVYTVYVTNTLNGCNSAATTNTVQIVADANIPTVTLSANNAILTCVNTTTNVTANANVGTATYNWSPTTGIVSGANTNTPTFNAPGSYSLVVTNTANSCVTGNSDYVVTVVSNTTAPVVSLSAGSNTGTITCSNPNVVVSPTINPSSGLTYTWSPTTGLSSNPNQANATFIANGVYQLSVTDVVTGCVSVLDAASSFTVVSNIDTPTISVVPTSSNTILGCGTNATVMYSVSVTSASGNNSYNWQPSGSNSVFTTVSGAGIHSVTVTDNINGCSTSTTFNVLTDTTIPSITAADSTLFPCDSNATALIASSSNPNVSYAWQGASVLSGANSNVASIGSVGVYTVTVTDNVTNCFSTHTVAVTMDSVVALFSANPNIGVEPLIVTFFNSSVSSNTANTTYSWDFGNASPTSTLTNPSNTFELSGVYSVTLVATLGVCSDSAYTTVIVNEDVTLIIPNFFTPNGDSQNELFFITGIEKYPNNQLEIYNRWGSLVYLKKAYNNTFEGKPNQPSMGNGMLPTGTYFYVLDLGDNTTKPFKGYIELKY